MNRETEYTYHLQLAHDLILFLMGLQMNSLSQEQKVRRTDMIIESWYRRVEKQIEILNKKNIKQLAQDPGTNDSEDVLAIISGIHSFELKEIRKAFKDVARQNIIKSYNLNMGR